ncbi:MAG: (2Fe-2S)-binding protein [Chloroflexi bacterium]|nr:(2Fe-2S)-binding protein [Chloroflexota bacterium]
MPKVTIDGRTIDVVEGTRLVNVIEDAKVSIGHRCGGKSRCTTCRVSFTSGEPDTMTSAEHAKLKEREMLGQYRLACQILVTHDMSVTAHVTLDSMPDWTDTGPRCTDEIEPEAVFIKISDLA